MVKTKFKIFSNRKQMIENCLTEKLVQLKNWRGIIECIHGIERFQNPRWKFVHHCHHRGLGITLWVVTREKWIGDSVTRARERNSGVLGFVYLQRHCFILHIYIYIYRVRLREKQVVKKYLGLDISFIK
jgi:hypothetical protein